MRTFIAKLESSVAAQPKRSTKSLTSRISPAFATTVPTIPESLHSPQSKAIGLRELAAKLGVEVERLLPAIKCGYLRVITATPPVVYEPPPAAIEFLREMLRPLPMRSFLPIAMVAELEALTVNDVRELCLAYDIPIQMDALFAELMTPAAFFKLHSQLHHHRDPSRFDRQAMIVALLQAVDPETWKHSLKPPPFSKRLEQEIRRIAKLPEPHKTEMALRLCDAYQESKSITDIIAHVRGKQPAEFREVERAEKIIAVTDADSPC